MCTETGSTASPATKSKLLIGTSNKQSLLPSPAALPTPSSIAAAAAAVKNGNKDNNNKLHVDHHDPYIAPGHITSVLGIIWYHYKQGNIHLYITSSMIVLHLGAICGLLRVSTCSNYTLAWTVVLLPISGMGITAGAHRLWSHKSYEACFAVRVLLMICNSIASQGSIYHWTRDHRIHHKFSETNADPHNSTRGFFFSHIGWLLLKKHPDVIHQGNNMDLSDLLDDPVVRFQRYLHPWFALTMCMIMPTIVGCYGWNESILNGLLVPGALRYTMGLHMTFLVNSAAHVYGDHPYDPTIPSAENPIVSFFAFGEGWHNYHHKYPYDYATSEYGIVTQYNPTKLFLDILANLGFIWNRKRALSVWELTKRQKRKQSISIMKKD